MRPPANDRGATAVEVAIMLPLLLGVLFGIIEFGWASGQRLDARQATSEGVRLVTVDWLPDGIDPTTVTEDQRAHYLVDAVCQRTTLAENLTVTLTMALSADGDREAGNLATLTVEGDLQTITGFFDPLLGDINLDTEAAARMELDPSWSDIGPITCTDASATVAGY